MQNAQSNNLIKRGFQFDNLNFIRVFDLNLIPRQIIEQVKNRDLDVNLFYQMNDNIVGNPFSIIYAIADEDYRVSGILWISVHPLEKCLWGHILSVNKEHQNKGITKAVIQRLIEMKDLLGLDKVKCITTRPKALERAGMKRSENIIMEIR